MRLRFVYLLVAPKLNVLKTSKQYTFLFSTFYYEVTPRTNSTRKDLSRIYSIVLKAKGETCNPLCVMRQLYDLLLLDLSCLYFQISLSLRLHYKLLLRIPIYFFQMNARDQSYELKMLLNSLLYWFLMY